jgi:hypothetical protein
MSCPCEAAEVVNDLPCGSPAILILLVNSKSGERHYQNEISSPLGGEYRLLFVLRKVRTSLRKSNFPTESFIAPTADLSAFAVPLSRLIW